MIAKVFIAVIFIIGLVYLLAPGPDSINYFPPLPGSTKSTQAGDTWQNPNIAAYYSNFWRSDVTNFYYQKFSYLKIFGITIPPLFINHPPEEAFQYIRDQQESTYLEEYFYPLRDQVFVNGYEPYNQQGVRFDKYALPVVYYGVPFNSKTTIRYYPSSPLARVINYVGIWLGVVALFWMGKKVVKEEV